MWVYIRTLVELAEGHFVRLVSGVLPLTMFLFHLNRARQRAKMEGYTDRMYVAIDEQSACADKHLPHEMLTDLPTLPLWEDYDG
jgi:hypothetical protein